MVILFPVLIRSSGSFTVLITIILTARSISKPDYNQRLSQSQLLNPVMIWTYMKLIVTAVMIDTFVRVSFSAYDAQYCIHTIYHSSH